MLVLSRRCGEGVTIGPDIRVVVLGVKSGHVRLGIEAPRAVPVHREEIYARIQDENRMAAKTQAVPLDAFRRLIPAKRRMGL
ncbi:MAG: carbon storage regulator CsrA [Nitrospira sp.]|jgi:carbon storage regulator|nr:carbon storage regulator CsrA [Nitrospira sp.]